MCPHWCVNLYFWPNEYFCIRKLYFFEWRVPSSIRGGYQGGKNTTLSHEEHSNYFYPLNFLAFSQGEVECSWRLPAPRTQVPSTILTSFPCEDLAQWPRSESPPHSLTTWGVWHLTVALCASVYLWWWIPPRADGNANGLSQWCHFVLFIYFILTALGLHCSVLRLLSSCPTASGILIPQWGTEPVSPALEGGLLTTGPPGKSHGPFISCQMMCRCKAGWEYVLWLLAMSPQEAVPSQQCPAGHGHHAGRADQLACWQHWGGAWHDLQSLCHSPGHTWTLSSHHQGLRGKWHLGAGLGSLKMKAEY